MSRFTPTWEPTLLSEEIIASGTWWYDDTVPHKAELIKRTFDYTSEDLLLLDEILHGEFLDYIDYAISDSGSLYFWRFTSEASQNVSKTLSTFFEAYDHINTYGSRHDIQLKQG